MRDAIEEISEGLFYIKNGDMFCAENHVVITNTINCVGVMGAGIAKECKKRYPDMFEDYIRKCEKREILTGFPYLFTSESGRTILNFPTKNDYKKSSKLDFIERGLQYLVDHAEEWGIKHIAFPPLGCGNGKLEWYEVFPVMKAYLGPLGKKGLRIDVYSDQPVPNSIPVPIILSPKRGPMDQFVVKSPGSDSMFSHKKRKGNNEELHVNDVPQLT